MICIIENEGNKRIASNLNMSFESYVALNFVLSKDSPDLAKRVSEMSEEEATVALQQAFKEKTCYTSDSDVIDIINTLYRAYPDGDISSLIRSDVEPLLDVIEESLFHYTDNNGNKRIQLFKTQLINTKNKDNSSTQLKKDAQLFLSNFGLTLQDLDSYSGDVPLFDAVNRVINAKSDKDITDGVGYAIAFMMQHDDVFRDAVAFSKTNPQGIKGITRGINRILLKSNNLKAKLGTEENLRYIGNEIAKELRKLYNLNTDSFENETNKENSLFKKIWAIINRFFQILSDSQLRRRLVNASLYAKNAAKAVKNNDKTFIVKDNIKPGSDKEGTALDIRQSIKENPYEASIASLMASHGIALAGSASIAVKGTIYRHADNPLHDLDFSAKGKTEEEIENILKQNFKFHIKTNVIQDNDPNDPEKRTLTYLVIDREVKEEPIPGTKAVNIIDVRTGEIIGRREYSDLVLKEGVQGKMLDFFVGDPEFDFQDRTTLSIDGKDYLFSDPRNAFQFKVEVAREKDIFDYNRYVPYSTESISETKDVKYNKNTNLELLNFLKKYIVKNVKGYSLVEEKTTSHHLIRYFKENFDEVWLTKLSKEDATNEETVHDQHVAKLLVSNYLKQLGLDDAIVLVDVYDNKNNLVGTKIRVFEKKLKDAIKEHDKIVDVLSETSDKTSNLLKSNPTLLKFLEKRLGVDFKFISTIEAKKLLGDEYNSKINAFNLNGIAYFIDGKKITADIKSEEMLHPFVASMHKYKPEVFNDLLNDAKNNFKKLYTELLNTYDENEVDEELVTQALARVFVEERLQKQKPKSFIQRMLVKFKQWIVSVFSSEPTLALKETSLKGIVQLINSDTELIYEKVENLSFNISLFDNINDGLSSQQTINIYAGTNENAELSNFALRPFTLDPKSKETLIITDASSIPTFQSVEQAFQWAKMEVFALMTGLNYNEDTSIFSDIQKQILATTNGATLRKLGRTNVNVKPKVIKHWDNYSSDIMKVLIKASFEQNPEALQKLLDTGNAILTHTQDKSKWGTEFPRILMEVREELEEKEKEETVPEPLTPSLPKSFTVKDGTINMAVFYDKKTIVEDIKRYTYDMYNPIGEKLQLDPEQFDTPQDLVKAIKIMNSQVSNYIYNYYDGTETFEALSKEWQEVLKENGIEFIPKYIFGRTIDESIVMDQENTLINSNMIKMSELRDWSRSAVAQLSYNLSLLKTSPAANEQFFGDDFKNENFIGNSTEEILEKVGVERVLTELMKEPIFNIYKNSAANEDFDVSDKMELIYNNFRGFLNLCYDQLLASEGIVLQSKRDAVYYDPVQETQGDSQDVVVQDEATLAEEHGSSLEHWQVGFRSVSPHNSLSKEVRSRLANMLDLNKDGTPKKNELGLNKFIDVHNVVNQILLFTQNSESLNNKNEKGEYESTSMIAKLQKYAKRHPWINQLVGTYYPNGDTSQQQVAGILVSNEPVDESIKSMFYNNFQKYFQKYNVMYYQSGKGMIFKTLNTSSFTQDTLDTLQDKINTKEQGGLSLYDSIAGTWKVNEVKALTQQISQVLRYVQTVSATGLIWGSSSSSLLEQAYKMLDIPLPSSDEFDGLLKQANKSELQSLLQAASYSLKAVVDGANNSDFDLYKSISNNVKTLSEFISPLMATELQSVFYQDGKSYYSYVLPSYLNKYITKLSGITENYAKFLENEFGKYTGWFKDDNGKWLNYWLEVLDKDPSARKELEHSALLSDNGVGYTDKTPSQYASSIICNYFYSKSAKRFAWFRVPTLSNKPSEEYIKFVKITENFEDTISELLATNTFKQEVNRIKAVRARRKLAETTSNPQNKEKIEEQKKELLKKLSRGNLSIEERKELNQKIDMLTMDKDTAITNFDKNGDKFHFLKFLNDEIAKGTTLGKLVNKYIDGDLGITEINEGDTTYNSEIEYLNDLLKRSIKEDIMSSYNQFKEMLVENGTIVVDENGNYRTSDMKNLQSALQTRNGRSGEDLLREFYFNDFFAQTNIMQLTITDLAFYKNTEDLQKRLAQLHAPSMKPNINATINGERVSDGKFRTVYIKDAEVMSNAIENLKKARDRILANPRYAKDEIVYNQVKARLNDVINQFKKVNWADAQGYTSPTAYRKRMAMFGKWDQRQEDAYNQLKEGKVSVDNLDILWQPLKPFGYSQISVNGHNPFMPNIKMGIQNKNSEYLLIMADAILKGGKVNNKLSALYDIMEESYNRPNSKDKGIDAIQFESTVKVGKRSVIDINGATTAAEVKQIFNDRLYNDDQYNTEYVQEYNFEDYGIQQEVPAHFEGSQQHGSQVRILTISDISAKDANGNENYLSINGEMKKVSECRDNYLAAIERNINRSIDELEQRFNLNTYNSKMVNKAISDLLRDEILRDGRYGTDMLQAVSLNEKGEFNVPLSNPVHSDRIQQLLNSIIKNSIWKQKIAGGPVVQVSSYGLSEDLEIKWREDGTIEYFECYIPIPDENIYKDFVKEDGTIDIAKMEKTNPKLLDMFGYRIPTESKYSMVPIKVKGFLPRNAGEGIMLPKEITLLSGSDFDIDKLYIMRYEFDRHEVWSDEKLGDLKNSIYDTTGELYSKQQIKDHLTGKQIIENESVARLLSEAKPEVEYRNPKSGRAADNNIIIDYSLAFLTSSYALEQLTTPGNFDEPKRVGYLIQACKNSGRSYSELSNMTTEQLKEIAYKDQSLLHVQTQIAFHRQNMVAGQLIGAFAQGNVSHAFVSLWNDMGHKSGIDIRKSELIDETFKINGISFSGMVEIDPEYEIDQHKSTRVSANLSAYLAASVDAVKDPILNLMNINMDTINIVIPLIRMGIDIETVGLLLSHPAVIDITNKGGLKNGRKGLVERINEYLKDYQQDSSFDINKEFLAGQLNKEYNPEVHDPDDLQVLFAVFNIMKLGNTFRSITSATRYNSISSAVGPFMSDTAVRRNAIENFADVKTNTKMSKDLREIIDAENGMPILKSIISNAHYIEDRIFGGFSGFSYIHDLRRQLKDIESSLGYMNPTVAKKFYDFYVSYAEYIEGRNLFDMSDENRDYILNTFPEEFKEARSKHIDNKLVQAIKLKTDSNGNVILSLPTRGYSTDQVEDFKNAWADLYEEDEELAKKLIEYNFFRGSFTFSPKTFMHLLPISIMQKLCSDTNNASYVGNVTRDFQKFVMDNAMDQFKVINGLADIYLKTEEELKSLIKYAFEISRNSDKSVHFIVKLGKDYLYVDQHGSKPIDNLGGNGQAFEIDPARPVYEIHSVLKNQQATSEEEGNNAKIRDNSEAEPIDIGEQRTILSRTTVQSLLGEEFDMLMTNGLSEADVASVFVNKLSVKFERAEISKRSGLSYAVLDAIEDAIKQYTGNVITIDELNRIIQELNLC